MAALQRFLAILLADLRERTRSPRFWVLLGLMIVATWKCFPPLDAHYLVVSLNEGERGAYSSAWVGMVLAMAYSPLLSLFGFYVVRGTLVRDIDTRVWQLLVATPMTRGGYLLAKWASHMAVFALIVAAGLGVALLAQYVRGEDRTVDLLELVKPVLLLNLPGLAMTAMFAVWFDLLPWLRRTAGNVLYFILWIALLSVPLSGLDTPNDPVRTGWRSDPNGLVMVARDFHRVREQQTGLPQKYAFTIGHAGIKKTPVRFVWKSWSVRAIDVLGRALWLFGALAGVLLAAPLLDWAAARSSSAAKNRSRAGSRLRWLDRLLDPLARGPLAILTVAELKLSLRQRRFWWWLAALFAFGLQIFGTGMGFFGGMLLAWILPLDILARGVLREKDHGTGGLVFASPHILRRLLTARFAVGVTLLLALTLPGLLRLLATFPLAALTALVICASVVSWGLCLGALCRNARPFELAMVTAAYVALDGVALFDLSANPQVTLVWHAILLLPAWLALAWAWPRLARV
jgi:ABC-type transport system involved in multi-copper enzyme maturation permease subunit